LYLPSIYNSPEEEVLPGRPLPQECKPELHTDYGGDAVKWGLTHHKDSAADCCQACLDHAKRAKEGEKKCNIWVYCPSEFGCHSPDVYQHKHQECWLKYVSSTLMNLIPLLYIRGRFGLTYLGLSTDISTCEIVWRSLWKQPMTCS
jgi:hypothetical protein